MSVEFEHIDVCTKARQTINLAGPHRTASDRIRNTNQGDGGDDGDDDDDHDEDDEREFLVYIQGRKERDDSVKCDSHQSPFVHQGDRRRGIYYVPSWRRLGRVHLRGVRHYMNLP